MSRKVNKVKAFLDYFAPLVPEAKEAIFEIVHSEMRAMMGPERATKRVVKKKGVIVPPDSQITGDKIGKVK